MDLKNKTVWIIGASSGIGASMVGELAKEDCNIIMSARSADKLNALTNSLNLDYSRHLVLPFDISKTSTFENAIATAQAKFNKIDVLILNAGIAHKSIAEETIEDVDRRVMEVNFMGIILFTKKMIPILKQQAKASIAVTSSILGEFGLPLVSTYCASKHAINGYFESLRYELEQYAINVTILSPGFINTEITKNSLTAKGGSFNKNSVAQEKGMDSVLCARKMIKAIKKEKRKVYIGGIERFMPTVSYYFPRIFYWLMKKLHNI